jgi:two-component system sensor histidine kinase BaeS
MIDQLVEDTAISAEAAGMRVESDLATGVRVSGDAMLLRTAIANLLSNATKHNAPGGRISVRLAADGKSATLEIANTGTPIPKNERGAIFDRFQRGRNALDAAREGSGLGLSLAREIIAAHGGTLALADDRGDGMTRFVVTMESVPHG